MDVLILFSGMTDDETDDETDEVCAAWLVKDAISHDVRSLVELAAVFNSDVRWIERGRTGVVQLRQVTDRAALNGVAEASVDAASVMLAGRGPVSASYAEALRRSIAEARTSSVPPEERAEAENAYMAALATLTPPNGVVGVRPSRPPNVVSGLGRMLRAMRWRR